MDNTVHALRYAVLSVLFYKITNFENTMRNKIFMAIAIASLSITASQTASAQSQDDTRQIQCMAENVYHEAGNQSQRGMIAVSNVVMNRVQSGQFPNTPCSVIYQRNNRMCQFSWVCMSRSIRDSQLFRRAREVAEMVYYGRTGDVTNGSTFYHATYINPGWFATLRRTVRIGDHIFYRR
jgi:spore germination cell wall hydrolase CwlJ-like protein